MALQDISTLVVKFLSVVSNSKVDYVAWLGEEGKYQNVSWHSNQNVACTNYFGDPAQEHTWTKQPAKISGRIQNTQ